MPQDATSLQATVDRVLYLRRVPIFGTLLPRHLGFLASVAEERLLAEGERLVTEGELIEFTYVVVEGGITISMGQVPRYNLRPGESAGLFEAFAGALNVSVAANIRSRVLAIPMSAIRSLLEEDFDAVLRIFQSLGAVLIQVRQRFLDNAGFAEHSARSTSIRKSALDLVDRLVVLRRAVAFHSAGLDGLALIAARASEVSTHGDAPLWAQDDAAKHVIVIVDGEVSCSVRDGAFRFTFGPGDTPGFLDMLADQPRWYAAKCIGKFHGLRIDRDDLLDVFEDHAEMSFECLGAFAAMGVRLFDLASSRGGARLQTSLPVDALGDGRDR